MGKRLLSILLVMIMVVGLFPLTVFGAEIIDSGTCGDNLTWTLDENGTLTISGTGDMDDWGWKISAPWGDYYDIICNVYINNGITSIGDYAFYSLKGLTNIDISNTVTSIGNVAFANCKSLKKIILPESITEICISAFSGCSNLTSIDLPNNLTSISIGAFMNCASLTSITIPDTIKSINESVFYGCTNLINIALPNTITEICGGAFAECNSLFDIYYKGTKTQWKNITKEGNNDCLSYATIHYNSSGVPKPFIVSNPSVKVNSNGNIYTFNVKLNNIFEESTLIIALYDENGSMIGIKDTIVSAEEVSKTVMVYGNNAKSAKLFLWNDIQNMIPLCNSVEKQIQ